MEEKRDGFFFYRSFYEAIQLVPDESKLNLYQALGEYAILGKEPQINGWELALFTTWKINVDKANSRREASIQNGSKGGRPTKSDVKPKKNQIEPEENLKTISKYLEKNNFQIEKPEVNLNNNINQKENDEFVESGTEQLELKNADSQDLFTGITGEDKIKENDQKFQFEKRYNKLKKGNSLLPFEEIMKELLMKYNEIFKNLNLQKLQNRPFANWKSYEKLLKSNTDPIIIFYELVKGLQFILSAEDERNCYYIEPF